MLPSPLAAALDHVGRGFAVVPLYHPILGPEGAVQCACRRGADCGTIGKHPRLTGWQFAATADPDRLRAWWRQWPAANIGIRTGRAPTGRTRTGRPVYAATGLGLLALDVDPRHGGDEALAELEDEHGRLSQTVRTVTGGGGSHILFTYSGPFIGNVQNSGQGVSLGPGLDVRADGGQIVAPGSIHWRQGRRYEWDAGAHPDDVPLAPAPAWLLALLRRPVSSLTLRPPLVTADVLAGVDEGERDTTLYRLACKLRRADVPQAWAERLVCEAAANCRPPFAREDALAKVASAYARYEASVHVLADIAAEVEAVTAAGDTRPVTSRLRVREVRRHA